MISLQKIQIEPLCKDHSIPFAYICTKKDCLCNVRLCEKCLTEHEADDQNSNIMKIDNYVSKIQTSVKIVNAVSEEFSKKQNSTVPNSILQTFKKLEKFVLNQIHVLQDSMKYINEESARVNYEIKEACNALQNKMENIDIRRKQISQKYCRKVYQNKMVDHMVTFYSQAGFYNFRKKLDKTLQFRGIIKDFLGDADKYGKKYEQFMKKSSPTISGQWSMKLTITNLLKSKNSSKFDGIRQNPDSRNNNFINQQNPNPSTRQKRSRTIFGKA